MRREFEREPEGLFRDLAPPRVPAAERPVYQLMIRALPGINPMRALRWALKAMLRQHGFQCISIEEHHALDRSRRFEEDAQG